MRCVGGDSTDDSAREDGVQQGSSDRTAELVARIDRCRRHSRVAGGDAGGACLRNGREDQTETCAHQQQRRQDARCVVGVKPDAGQPERARSAKEHPEPDQRAGSGAGHQHDARDVVQAHRQDDHREEGEAGRDGREGEILLHVEVEEQHDSEHPCA